MPTKELNEEEYLGGGGNGRSDDEINAGGLQPGITQIVTDETIWGKDADPRTGREEKNPQDNKEQKRNYSEEEKREAQSDYDQSAYSQNISNKEFRVNKH